MRLSELIAQLEQIVEDCGDVEIKVYDPHVGMLRTIECISGNVFISPTIDLKGLDE